jgi:hypothetical protein
VSHRSCSQGKLRACPLLHHPLKTSLDYYYSTIPRSFPDLTCNSSSITSTTIAQHHHSLWCRRDSFSSFIHCSNRASRHSFPAPFHSLPTAVLFFVPGRLDTPITRRLFSISTCSRTAALHIHTLLTLNPISLVAGRLYSTTHGFHPSQSAFFFTAKLRSQLPPHRAFLRKTSIVASNNCNTLTGHRYDNSRSPNQLAAHIIQHDGRHAGTSDAATPTR